MDDIRARFDAQVRRNPQWTGVERVDPVVRVVSDSWRGVAWSDLDERTADSIIAREIDRFAELGTWEWKHYSYDAPRDLPDRLRSAGFIPEDEETLLAATIDSLDLAITPPSGVELLAIDDEAGVEALIRVHDEVFGGDHGALGRELIEQVRAGRAAGVVALAGGRPISSGRIEFYDGTDFASLFGGGTVPEWRHRGVFRAVVAHRAALAADRGHRYLQTDASDDSRPILERLGFVPFGTTTPFIHP